VPRLHALGHETHAQAVAESTKVTASHGSEGRVAGARETAKPPGSPAPAILRGGGAVWRPLGSQ